MQRCRVLRQAQAGAIRRHAATPSLAASPVTARSSQHRALSISPIQRPVEFLTYARASCRVQRPTFQSASQARTYTSEATSRPTKPDFLDAAESEIWTLLEEEFAPTELSVRDVSGGCGSMYAVEITSAKFKGTNMLKQQRMVNAVLKDKMKDWHGLQLKTSVPK